MEDQQSSNETLEMLSKQAYEALNFAIDTSHSEEDKAFRIRYAEEIYRTMESYLLRKAHDLDIYSTSLADLTEHMKLTDIDRQKAIENGIDQFVLQAIIGKLAVDAIMRPLPLGERPIRLQGKLSKRTAQALSHIHRRNENYGQILGVISYLAASQDFDAMINVMQEIRENYPNLMGE